MENQDGKCGIYWLTKGGKRRGGIEWRRVITRQVTQYIITVPVPSACSNNQHSSILLQEATTPSSLLPLFSSLRQTDPPINTVMAMYYPITTPTYFSWTLSFYILFGKTSDIAWNSSSQVSEYIQKLNNGLQRGTTTSKDGERDNETENYIYIFSNNEYWERDHTQHSLSFSSDSSLVHAVCVFCHPSV